MLTFLRENRAVRKGKLSNQTSELRGKILIRLTLQHYGENIKKVQNQTFYSTGVLLLLRR